MYFYLKREHPLQSDSQGGLTDEVMKFQIRKTIEEHLKKEKRLNKLGIKSFVIVLHRQGCELSQL